MLGVSHQSVSRQGRAGLENLLKTTLMSDESLDGEVTGNREESTAEGQRR